VWDGKRISWDTKNGAWHTGHFLIFPNRWWEQFGLFIHGPPATWPLLNDTFTLNFLTGRGFQGRYPAQGWKIYPIPGLVTAHAQETDEVFKSRGRENFH